MIDETDRTFHQTLAMLSESFSHLSIQMLHVQRYSAGGGKINNMIDFEQAMSAAANSGVRDFYRFRIKAAGTQHE